MLIDPPHLRSFDEPCFACGARWEPVTEDPAYSGQMQIRHRDGCAYHAGGEGVTRL